MNIDVANASCILNRYSEILKHRKDLTFPRLSAAFCYGMCDSESKEVLRIFVV